MPIVRIELLPGRSGRQKAEAAERITQLITEVLECSPESVDVIYVEIQPLDWARAGKMYSAPK